MVLPKYSLGVGDRFAHQAQAQLRACMLASEAGIEIAPVWNKSNREHLIIGSDPQQTRVAADVAVKDLGWKGPYFLDADHITRVTFDRFVEPCDFFTMDVAEEIGKSCSEEEIRSFLERHKELQGELVIPGIAKPIVTDAPFLEQTARHFLQAVQEAGALYRAIKAAKNGRPFIPEISMDETNSPQSPAELLVILAAVAEQGIPIQTIAPKFTGRFNKGVDYVGDVAQFAREFREDIATIAYAVAHYGLPANLKLSVHSGSDKFSLYPHIHQALQETGAGVHVKTAGTTWLEEVIGLAEAGGDGLALAKEIYVQAYDHLDELCAPYATVIDIDRSALPSRDTVAAWTAKEYTGALRHEANPAYNASFRQLLHVAFKIAARMGTTYTDALVRHKNTIARNVTENLYRRHIQPIFLGAD